MSPIHHIIHVYQSFNYYFNIEIRGGGGGRFDKKFERKKTPIIRATLPLTRNWASTSAVTFRRIAISFCTFITLKFKHRVSRSSGLRTRNDSRLTQKPMKYGGARGRGDLTHFRVNIDYWNPCDPQFRSILIREVSETCQDGVGVMKCSISMHYCVCVNNNRIYILRRFIIRLSASV